MSRSLYRPVGLLFSVLGGVAAAALFQFIWRRVSDDEAPKATRADSSWRQILPAAALEGAIFGAVKAAVDRVGLRAYQKATGVWAGD